MSENRKQQDMIDKKTVLKDIKTQLIELASNKNFEIKFDQFDEDFKNTAEQLFGCDEVFSYEVVELKRKRSLLCCTVVFNKDLDKSYSLNFLVRCKKINKEDEYKN